MNIKKLTLVGALTVASTAFSAPIYYVTGLSGANENPANASPGTGFAEVVMDTAAHTMLVHVEFTGLTAPNTAAHIHCCVAPPGNVGVATTTPTFTGFPGGTTSGSYTRTFDTTLTSSFSAAFVTANGGTAAGAEARLATGLAAGQAYFNIHSSNFPGGEIRGFLQAAPEPTTLALVGGALAGLILMKRRTI